MSGQWGNASRAERIKNRLRRQYDDCNDGWRRKGDGKFDRRRHADGTYHWNGDRVVFTPSKSKDRK